MESEREQRAEEERRKQAEEAQKSLQQLERQRLLEQEAVKAKAEKAEAEQKTRKALQEQQQQQQLLLHLQQQHQESLLAQQEKVQQQLQQQQLIQLHEESTEQGGVDRTEGAQREHREEERDQRESTSQPNSIGVQRQTASSPLQHQQEQQPLRSGRASEATNGMGGAPLPRPSPPLSLKEKLTVKGSREGIEFRVRSGQAALEQWQQRQMQRQQWEAGAAQIRGDSRLKPVRREVERGLVKLLQQISATQDQVRRKSEEIVALLRNASAGNGHPLPVGYLLLTFSDKVLAQSQACKLPTVAFALAQVVVNVDTQVPGVLDSVLGALNQHCMYTVPQQYALMARNTQSPTEEDLVQLMRLCGYKEVGSSGELEPTDVYVERIVGCATLFGALLQAGPHGSGAVGARLGLAWQWCATLLNHLVPDRCSATALEAFLKVTGHRLSVMYPRPFHKLLATIVRHFLPRLKQLEDPDVSPVATRLIMYIEGGKHKQAPEGSVMPKTDVSSSLRA